MFLIRKAATTLFMVGGAILLFISFNAPSADDNSELSLLMEPDGTGVWRDLIAQFHELHPDIRVRLVEGPPATNTREDMYSTSFLSGDAGYDIVYADVVWVPKFAAAGWLLDLTDRISREDLEDYLPVEIRAGSYNGRIYRNPGFTDAGLLYYRRDLVATPPETFEDLVSISSMLATEDRWGFVWQGKQYEGLVTAFLEVLWGYGGDWINPDTREVLIDSPAAVQAIEFLKQTIGTISPPGVTTYIEEDTRNIFQNGRAVFLRNWPYVWTLMRRNDPDFVQRVAFRPMVHAGGQQSAATLGGWGFGISKFTEDPEGAWKFVEFVTRPERLRVVQERMGRIPSRRSMIPAEFLPILTSARPRPPIPEYAQASDILQRWLTSALTGATSPEQAISQTARETRLLLEH
jgi:multiple sugar transport system substrate-binding protein